MSSRELLCTYCTLPVNTVGKKLLDGLSAVACESCKLKSPGPPNSARVSAPWSMKEVASLKIFQNSPAFYHYVCPKQHDLSVATDGLHCDKCNYNQIWAYSWSTKLDDNFGAAGTAGVPRNPRVPDQDITQQLR